MLHPSTITGGNPHKRKKTSTYSPYFPPPPSVPTKSPYFKVSSKSKNGTKARGRTKAQKVTPSIHVKREDEGPTHSSRGVTVNQITDEGKSSNPAKNEQDDGWLTEHGSHSRKPSLKARLRRRRGHGHKQKGGTSGKHMPSHHLLPDEPAIHEPEISKSSSERDTKVGKAGVRRYSPTMKVLKKKMDHVAGTGIGTRIEVDDSQHNLPQKHNKRKRVPAGEGLLANTTNPSLAPLLNFNQMTTVPRPEDGSQRHKNDGSRRKRAKTNNGNVAAENNRVQELKSTNIPDHADVFLEKLTRNDVRSTGNSISNVASPSVSSQLEQPAIPFEDKTIPNPNTPTPEAPIGFLTCSTEGFRDSVTVSCAKPHRKRFKNRTGKVSPHFASSIIQKDTTKLRKSKRTGKTSSHFPPSTTQQDTAKPRKRKRTEKMSSYFASSTPQGIAAPRKAEKKCTSKKVPAGTSIISWPPFSAERFGLIQEELRHNPFHVIIATIFLNKTRGATAVPLLRQFLVDYPTPLALSQGDLKTITDFLQPLGLHHTRAARLINLGKVWEEQPPTPWKGVRKYNYPMRDTKPFNIPILPHDTSEQLRLGVEQNNLWEVAHLPGVGAYALDSWRIFCLDELRKETPRDPDDKAPVSYGNEEWRRVVPKDKELRAYLRWRWAKEGVNCEEEAGILEGSSEDAIDHK